MTFSNDQERLEHARRGTRAQQMELGRLALVRAEKAEKAGSHKEARRFRILAQRNFAAADAIADAADPVIRACPLTGEPQTRKDISAMLYG